MDQWIARSLANRRTPTVLLALFGAIALVLSAIGIYGVLAFGVAQRVREFGIRQALGADRHSILSLVIAQGMRTIAIGVGHRSDRIVCAHALSCRRCWSALPATTPSFSQRSPACSWPSRSPRATFRRGARPTSTPWLRCRDS
jgi:hypothetical protein